MTSCGTRSLTTPRRHMLTTPISSELLTLSYRRYGMTYDLQQLPGDATQFLTWFSSLSAGNII